MEFLQVTDEGKLGVTKVVEVPREDDRHYHVSQEHCVPPSAEVQAEDDAARRAAEFALMCELAPTD